MSRICQLLDPETIWIVWTSADLFTFQGMYASFRISQAKEILLCAVTHLHFLVIKQLGPPPRECGGGYFLKYEQIIKIIQKTGST